MKVSISGLKRLETPSCGKCDCREVGMWERREIRRNRRNATYGRGEQALTNSTPTSKDVVVSAWIVDQLHDVELVVVVCNICLRTSPHDGDISAQHRKWRALPDNRLLWRC